MRNVQITKQFAINEGLLELAEEQAELQKQWEEWNRQSREYLLDQEEQMMRELFRIEALFAQKKHDRATRRQKKARLSAVQFGTMMHVISPNGHGLDYPEEEFAMNFNR
jgi:hypothetical protein